MVGMSPIELFHEARLTEALEAQRAVVAARPDDVGERLLLCDLLAFTGDREGVRNELDRLMNVPPNIQEYVREWQSLLHADDARHAGQPPDELPAWTEQLGLRLRADANSRYFDSA